MGNRAVITTEEKKIGVYMHWNGGADTIKPLLAYCKAQKFRSPETDCYGWSSLVTVIVNSFGGGGRGCGIDRLECLDCDNFDNGLYIIKDWEIIGREFYSGPEQHEYDFVDMYEHIASKQPKNLPDES